MGQFGNFWDKVQLMACYPPHQFIILDKAPSKGPHRARVSQNYIFVPD